MKIYLKLTEDQLKQLEPLQELVDDAYMDGKPGAILAQVSPIVNETVCRFCTNEEVNKIHKALGIGTTY